MAYYAKLGMGNTVIQVITIGNNILLDNNGIEQESLGTLFLQNLYNDPHGAYIKTSYNTIGGVHYGADGKPDGKPAVRANYASVGFQYDSTNDIFYNPYQPFPSWKLSAPTWIYTAPVPYPTDGNYYTWNENTQTWDLTANQPPIDVKKYLNKI
jgi:hypothetical protein